MASYTHDAVGNRLTKVSGGNTTSYGWDAVNRMIEAGPVNGSRNSYKYRADGMRVRKEISGLVEKVYYDGQMPVETFEDFSTGNDKLTRNFVGARGIEMMEMTQNSATTQAYPLYDTHGNMVATLSKNSLGTSWNLANERSYDVWGSVRLGVVTGGPKGRYVANLGHVADDESGLIYMRARYYEPETGRFLSEDPAHDGSNWYRYCSNDPINKVDRTGKSDEFYYELGSNLADIGRAMISIGMVLFGNGVRNFYKGFATWGKMWIPASGISPSGIFLALVGATFQMLIGVGSIIGGAKRVRSGLYASMAGAMLMALGEDGLEYAAAYLQACDDSNGGLPDRLFFEYQTGL